MDDDYELAQDEYELDEYDDDIYRVVEDDAPPALGFWERVVKLLASPFQLFENVKYNPKILQPVIALLIVSMGVSCFAVQLVGITSAEAANAMREVSGGASSEALIALESKTAPDNLKDFAMEFTVMTLTTSLGSLVSCLIPALWMLILCKLFRGEGKFTQFYSVTLHVQVAAFLVTIVSMALKLKFETSKDFLSLAPAFMPAASAASPGFLLLSAVNAANVWSAALIYVAFRALTGFKPLKATIVSAIYIAPVIFAPVIINNALGTLGSALQNAPA
ncbi:MAG: YIP1 family protein [Clostridiales bacterium]|nr:YIP1 family protein [Clostridiales bacterium]